MNIYRQNMYIMYIINQLSLTHHAPLIIFNRSLTGKSMVYMVAHTSTWQAVRGKHVLVSRMYGLPANHTSIFPSSCSRCFVHFLEVLTNNLRSIRFSSVMYLEYIDIGKIMALYAESELNYQLYRLWWYFPNWMIGHLYFVLSDKYKRAVETKMRYKCICIP